jgi:hypothetical protein
VGQNLSPCVELVIPFPGTDKVSAQKHCYYFQSLSKLAAEHLPQQMHKYFIAKIYCDGENPAVSSLVEKLADPRFRYKSTESYSNWGHIQTRLGILKRVKILSLPLRYILKENDLP